MGDGLFEIGATTCIQNAAEQLIPDLQEPVVADDERIHARPGADGMRARPG